MNDAADRIAELAARHPHAAALARYASLAVRIDAPLLRRLRLALLPAADASAEADLWFGPLAESRGDDGFVLDDGVTALLRAQLAAERLPDGRRALDAAAALTAALHAGLPASLQLEERVTALALAAVPGDADAAAAIEDALQPALVAMASGGQRAVEIARWALRAVPRLPPTARDGEAATALGLAAVAVLGGGAGPVASAAASPRGLPAALGWLVAPAAFSRRTRLACELSDRALVLRPAREDDAPGSVIDVPLTRPPVLEVGWTAADGTPSSRLHAVQAGGAMALPEGWSDLRVRTLDGAAYAVAPGAVAEQDDPLEALLDACTSVRCGSDDGGGVWVTPGQVLTRAHVVRDTVPVDEVPRPQVQVLRDGRWLTAQVEAADPGVDLALLTVHAFQAPTSTSNAVFGKKGIPARVRSGTGLPDGTTVPMPRAPAALGVPAALLAVQTEPPTRRHWSATVLAVAVRVTLDDRTYDDLLTIRLDDARAVGRDDVTGMPVVQGRAMVGMVGWRGSSELYATSARTIDRFLAWALRPEPDFPEIAFGYAPDDDYGKGIEMDEAAIGRVVRAARTARLRLASAWASSAPSPAPRWTGPSGELLPTAPEEGLSTAVHRAAGAACLFTPVAAGRGPLAEREMATIALRRWTDPAFPVALLAFRTTLPPLPLPLRDLPPVALDDLDDEALWLRLRDTFDGAAARPPAPNEGAFADAVRRALHLPDDAPIDGLPEGALDDLFAAAALVPPGEREAVEGAELAAMAGLPGSETLVRLRQAAETPPGERAVYLNAMPVQFARLLLRKAWFPGPPPPHLVIRDQEWPRDDDASGLVEQVRSQVSAALDVPDEAVRWLLQRADAPPAYAVIFATRPFPTPRLVANLKAALPSALLFFLGTEAVDPAQAAEAGVTLLPPLPDAGVSLDWIRRYKRMMGAVAPRGGSGALPPAEA